MNIDWSTLLPDLIRGAIDLLVLVIGGFAVYRFNRQRDLMKIRAENEGQRALADSFRSSLSEVAAEVEAIIKRRELRAKLTKGLDDPEELERLARLRDFLAMGGGGAEPVPPAYGIELAKALAYLLAAIVAAAALILTRLTEGPGIG